MIYGIFKTLNNETISVLITKAGSSSYQIGDDDTSQICWTSNPITINVEDGDIDECLISKKCTINLYTKIDIYDNIFAVRPWDVQVTVINETRSNKILFKGYVIPMSYNMDYSQKWNEINIECTDYIGTLQNTQYLNKDWTTAVVASGIKSFKSILLNIFNGYDVYFTYYDGHFNYIYNNLKKKCNDFVLCGEKEEDQKNCDYAANTILTYLGLKAIQNEDKIILFDPNHFTNTDVRVYDLRNDVTVQYPIVGNDYIKYHDGYVNGQYDITIEPPITKLKVEVEREKVDSVLPDLFKDSTYMYPNAGRLLYLREFATNSADSLLTLLSHRDDEWPLNSIRDDDAWTRRWYMQLLQNKDFVFYQKNGDVSHPSSQTRTLFKPLNGTDRQAPVMIEFTVEDKVKKGADTTPPSFSTYETICIPINGNGSDDESDRYPKYDDLQTTNGCMIKYENLADVNYSPVDEDTTNWLIFDGKMGYSPREQTTFINYRENDGQDNRTDRYETTFSQIINSGRSRIINMNGFGNNKYSNFTDISTLFGGTIKTEDRAKYYAQLTFLDDGTEMQTRRPIFPFIENADKQQKMYQYNYSQAGTDADKIAKFSTLYCSLQIGDKYLSETFEEDVNGVMQSVYEWTTTPSNFTLGFDPKIGDYIIGSMFDMQNNVTIDNNIKTKGMAVPIHKSDNLHGAMTFKVIAPVDAQWDEVTKKTKRFLGFPTGTKWKTTSHYILSHCSALWINKLSLSIESTQSTKKNPKDLVYVSDNNLNYVKNEKSVSFELCTGLTSQEADLLNVENDIYTNIVYDENDNICTSILDYDEQSKKAEEIFIQKWYDELSVIRKTYKFTIQDEATNLQRNYGNLLSLPYISLKENTLSYQVVNKLKSIEFDVKNNFITYEGII